MNTIGCHKSPGSSQLVVVVVTMNKPLIVKPNGAADNEQIAQAFSALPELTLCSIASLHS